MSRLVNLLEVEGLGEGVAPHLRNERFREIEELSLLEILLDVGVVRVEGVVVLPLVVDRCQRVNDAADGEGCEKFVGELQQASRGERSTDGSSVKRRRREVTLLCWCSPSAMTEVMSSPAQGSRTSSPPG